MACVFGEDGRQGRCGLVVFVGGARMEGAGRKEATGGVISLVFFPFLQRSDGLYTVI